MNAIVHFAESMLEEHRAMILEYWEFVDGSSISWSKTVASIADKYSIAHPWKVSDIVKTNSWVTIDGIACGCGTLRRFTSRIELKECRSRHPNHKCQECVARERDATARKLAMEAETVVANQRAWRAAQCRQPPETYVKWSLPDAIKALALLKARGSESLMTIMASGPLATPDWTLELDLLMDLWRRSIIRPHISSPEDAFPDPTHVCVRKIIWSISKSEAQDLIEDFDGLVSCAADETIADLLRNIRLASCRAMLERSMRQHGLEWSTGDKTIKTLNAALERWALAQVHGIIWRAAKDSSAYYARGGVSKRQAANTVVGAIARSSDRALSEGWNLHNHIRPERLSVIEEVVANQVLGIGESAWWYEITGERIGEAIQKRPRVLAAEVCHNQEPCWVEWV